MTALTSIEVLRLWEEGMDQSVTEKTLRLLSKACSVTDYREMGRLSIGERDGRLLQLRESMFGNTLKNLANCPNCNDAVEWEMTTANLYIKSLTEDLSVKTFLIEKNDFSIQFRLPDTHDVSGVMNDPSFGGGPKKLLAGCIIQIKHKGNDYYGKELPDEIWEALALSMEKEDPQADIRIKVQCPACTHQWESTFDIVSFLWAEINNWAMRILQEVYVLARAFGWTENDILKMSARRRRFYLQMIGS